MLLLEVHDEKTKKLLFQYDPVNEEIWIKPKNGDLVQVRLAVIKGRHAQQIRTYLSTTSTDPLST